MQRWPGQKRLRSLKYWVWIVVGAIVVLGLPLLPLRAIDLSQLPASQYSSTVVAPFNQPNYYPTKQTVPSNLYRPVAEWMGRLILPTSEQYQQFAETTQETDWAWFEIYTAPANAQNLVGQTIRLAWNKTPLTKNYIKVATRDVRFTPEADKDFQSGVINPIRLNNRKQVGPLQSLAGGHPYDDVTVQLWGKVTVEPGRQPTGESGSPTEPKSSDVLTTAFKPSTTLRIEREPLQETGRFYTLVKFLEPAPPTPAHPLPQQCPGEQPCTSDLMRVQHYNPKTRQFDGTIETIRIPQQPADVAGSGLSDRIPEGDFIDSEIE